MLSKKFNCSGLTSILLAGITSVAAAAQFKYIGYEVEFSNGFMGSWGETKHFYTEQTDVEVTATNTFFADAISLDTSRTISNLLVTLPADNRVYNHYSVDMTRETGTFGGITSQGPYNVLNAITPDGTKSFYFNTTTNVALSFSQEEYNSKGVGLMIRKSSTGMDNSSVAGTYVRYTMGNSFGGVATNGWGITEHMSLEQSIMEFDGAGNYSETANSWETERVTEARESDYNGETVIDTYFSLTPSTTDIIPTNSTYQVESDGTLRITSAAGIITNQVSADGDLVASILNFFQPNDFGGTYLTVAVRRPQNMPTNAVEAVYSIGELTEQFAGNTLLGGVSSNRFDATRSYIYLHADGTFLLRADHSSIENSMQNLRFNTSTNGTSDYVSGNLFSVVENGRSIELENGTYTISSNGVVSLQFENGEDGQGQLSANGEYLVAGNYYSEPGYRERMLIVGIHRELPEQPSAPVVFTNMTAGVSGLVIEATTPTNCPVEAIYTDDLTTGEWRSVGIYSNKNGGVEITDPGVTNADFRYYSATFAPW